jgi:hypothetical protein
VKRATQAILGSFVRRHPQWRKSTGVRLLRM